MADPEHRSIGEVLALLKAEHPDITISKIRFLESQGLISPERTPSGYRKFFESDVDRLRWILEQQRDNFLPLKVIKRRLDSGDPDGAVDPRDLPARLREPTLFSRADDDADPKSEPSTHDRSPTLTSKPPSTRSKSTTADGPLAEVTGSVSLTPGELADAGGVEISFIDDLKRLGLIVAAEIDDAVVYDHEALIVTRAAATFNNQGVQPRHLRMFKVAAERQAGMLEQLLGARAQRNGDEAALARSELGDLVTLGETIQRSILRRSLGRHLRDQ